MPVQRSAVGNLTIPVLPENVPFQVGKPNVDVSWHTLSHGWCEIVWKFPRKTGPWILVTEIRFEVHANVCYCTTIYKMWKGKECPPQSLPSPFCVLFFNRQGKKNTAKMVKQSQSRLADEDVIKASIGHHVIGQSHVEIQRG